MIKRILLLIFCFQISFLLVREIIYNIFLVPRLASWQELNILWEIVIWAPMFAVCVTAGVLAQKTKEWLLFCLLSSLTLTTLLWVEGVLNQPSNINAAEGGPIHFFLHFFIGFLLTFVSVGAVRLFLYWRLR